MLTLSDVVIFTPNEILIGNMPEWQKNLLTYKVYDCETLYNYVKSNHPKFRDAKYKSILTTAIRTLKKANAEGRKKLYIPIEGLSAEENKAIAATDLQVYGSSLPIYNPTFKSRTLKSISEFTISDIKFLISRIAIDGKNGLVNPIGTKRLLSRIAMGLSLYDRQLKRVMDASVENFNSNLFTVDFEEKQMIVEHNIKDIIDYLLSSGDDFVWGQIGELAKEKLKDALLTGNNYEYIEIILRVIRDYTTLEELSGPFLDDGTLKRFVMKPLDKH